MARQQKTAADRPRVFWIEWTSDIQNDIYFRLVGTTAIVARLPHWTRDDVAKVAAMVRQRCSMTLKLADVAVDLELVAKRPGEMQCGRDCHMTHYGFWPEPGCPVHDGAN